MTLRGIADADCSSFSSGSLYFDLGPFGAYGRQTDSPWAVNVNKTCAMLKASWALSIILILTFFVTFVSLTHLQIHPTQALVLTPNTAPRPPRAPQPPQRRPRSSQAGIPHLAPRPQAIGQPRRQPISLRRRIRVRRLPPTQLRAQRLQASSVLRLDWRGRAEIPSACEEVKDGRQRKEEIPGQECLFMRINLGHHVGEKTNEGRQPARRGTQDHHASRHERVSFNAQRRVFRVKKSQGPAKGIPGFGGLLDLA